MISLDPLVDASTRPIILSLLRSGESCGCRILQRARRDSGGQMKWSSAMLFYELPQIEDKENNYNSVSII